MNRKALAIRNLGSYHESLELFDRVVDRSDGVTRDFAIFNKTYPLFRMNRWDEGFSTLERGVKSHREHYECELFGKESSLLVFAVFQTNEAETLAERFGKLAEVYKGAKLIHWLGQGVVTCLRHIRIADFSESQLTTIKRAVEELATRFDALMMPARIFSTGLKYLVTEDETVFFDLLKSERDILLQTLRLEDNME